MVKIKVENETKHEKFRRIATNRTKNILMDIRLLGNCSNAATYEYTEEETKIIFSTIDKELRRVKSLFNSGSRNEFSL